MSTPPVSPASRFPGRALGIRNHEAGRDGRGEGIHVAASPEMFQSDGQDPSDVTAHLSNIIRNISKMGRNLPLLVPMDSFRSKLTAGGMR